MYTGYFTASYFSICDSGDSNVVTDNTAESIEAPIDQMVSIDIWGAREYLADTHSNIDYARENLQNSQKILQRAHALLQVPKKCSYEIVESIDELTKVDRPIDCNDEAVLPERQLKEISPLGKTNPLQAENTELHELDNFDKVNDDNPSTVEAGSKQIVKSMISPFNNNATSSTGHENLLQENWLRESMDNFIPSNEQKMSDETGCEDSQYTSLFVEKLKESVSTKSSQDDPDIDAQCCNDEFEDTCNSTNVIPLQHKSELPIHQPVVTAPVTKQESDHQKMEFNSNISSDSAIQLEYSIKNNQDVCSSQYFESRLIIEDEDCSKMAELASVTDFQDSETEEQILPQMNFDTDGLKIDSVGSIEHQPLNLDRLSKSCDVKYPKPLFAMMSSNVHRSVWDTIPNEIILHIFSFLSQRDLKQISLVCHRFYSIAKDNCLWSKLDVEATDITSSWLEYFTRVQQVKITRSKAKNVTNKSLRAFFQNSKDTLKSFHLSHCSDKYLSGDNILLHIATHCRKVNRISLPWSNTTDNGIDALVLSNLRLRYLDISGNCYISDSSFINLLQKCGAILETLKISGCFALTQNSFVAIADNCEDISVLEIGLCPKIGKESIILISSVLKNLSEFDLRGISAVDDYCLNCIAQNCKLLTKLVLANCKSLSDNGISNLSYDLPDLTSLDISGCSHISDDGCCSLAHALTHPNNLDFSSTSISQLTVVALTENFYHSLEYLKISFCNNITHDCVEKLISFCFRLKSLHVHGCKRINVKKLQKNHAKLLINK